MENIVRSVQGPKWLGPDSNACTSPASILLTTGRDPTTVALNVLHRAQSHGTRLAEGSGKARQRF